MPPRRRSPSLFRYELMWSRDPRFKDLLSSQWNQMATMSNFTDKLEGLKEPIRKWNTTVFGDVNKKLNDLRGRLSNIRQLPRTADNIATEERSCSAHMGSEAAHIHLEELVTITEVKLPKGYKDMFLTVILGLLSFFRLEYLIELC
ncbi:unnamed protein product [Rhodiola kirilowii]